MPNPHPGNMLLYRFIQCLMKCPHSCPLFYKANNNYAPLSCSASCVNPNDYAGDLAPNATLSIAVNPNDLAFSCDCPTVTRNSRFTIMYHRRTTYSNDTGFLKLALFIFCILVLFRRARVQQPHRVVERRAA